MENNARCPFCNGEFRIEGDIKTAACPHCGKEIDAVRAQRYFSAFSAGTSTTDLRGNDFFDYENILAAAAHYLSHGEWENARNEYLCATDRNAGDWRGYMGLVAVETKNYTDLTNESHKPFLKKALAVADDEGKKKINELYRIYSVKSSMSEEEFAAYNAEKQRDLKAKIKRAVLGLSKVNEGGKRKKKTAYIVMGCLLGAGAAAIIVGVATNIWLLAVAGGALMLGAYGPTVTISRQRYNEGLYELLAALFNGLKDLPLTFEQTDETLAMMSAALVSARNGDPTTSTDKILADYCEKAEGYGCEKLIGLLKGYRLTMKYFK